MTEADHGLRALALRVARHGQASLLPARDAGRAPVLGDVPLIVLGSGTRIHRPSPSATASKGGAAAMDPARRTSAPVRPTWSTTSSPGSRPATRYKNQDLSVVKNTKLVKDVNLQLRFEAFNVWNWHNFTAPGNAGSGLFAFDSDLASPTFGQWNGSVSSPRVIQIAARLEF